MKHTLKITVAAVLLFSFPLTLAKRKFELKNGTKKSNVVAKKIRIQNPNIKKSNKKVAPGETQELFSLDRSSKGQTNIYVDGKGPIKLKVSAKKDDENDVNLSIPKKSRNEIRKNFKIKVERRGKLIWKDDNVKIVILEKTASEKAAWPLIKKHKEERERKQKKAAFE